MTETYKSGCRNCSIFSRPHFMEVVRNFDLYIAMSDYGFRRACINHEVVYSTFSQTREDLKGFATPSQHYNTVPAVMADGLFIGLYYEHCPPEDNYWKRVIKRLKGGLDPNLTMVDHVELVKLLIRGGPDMNESDTFTIRGRELQKIFHRVRVIHRGLVGASISG